MSLRIEIFGADIQQVLGNGGAVCSAQRLLQTGPARTLVLLRQAEAPVLGES